MKIGVEETVSISDNDFCFTSYNSPWKLSLVVLLVYDSARIVGV